MMTVDELKEKQVQLFDEAKEYIEAHTDEEGFMNDESAKIVDEYETKISKLNEQIERMSKMEKINDKITATTTSEAIVEAPETVAEVKTGRASNEYKEAMLDAMRTNFRHTSNVLQESVDADGGYLVPETMEEGIVNTIANNNVVRGLATTIATTGTHKINVAASKPASAWTEEGEELSFGDATFSQVLLDAHKLIVAVKVTDELLYDAGFNLESYITEEFGKTLADAEENAFLQGTGDGQPEGIFTAGTAYTSSSTDTADQIIDLVYALDENFKKNAAFIINPTTVGSIRKLQDSTGAYIWQASYQDGEPDKLLGYPVYVSKYAPEDEIAFGDFSYYYIGDRGTRSIKQLTELFAGNDMVGYVAKERVDGKLTMADAVQILSIGATA